MIVWPPQEQNNAMIYTLHVEPFFGGHVRINLHMCVYMCVCGHVESMSVCTCDNVFVSMCLHVCV